MCKLTDGEFSLLYSRFRNGEIQRELEIYGLGALIEKGYITYTFTDGCHRYTPTNKGAEALKDRDRYKEIKNNR